MLCCCALRPRRNQRYRCLPTPPAGVRAHAASLSAALLIGALTGCSEPPPAKGKRQGHDVAGSEPADGAADAAQTPSPELPVAPANGFGDDITWRPLDVGLEEAKRSGRPLMLVVHTSWCSRCKALKPQFATPDVERLAERFVMVNVDQDEDERVMKYGPDGTYIPRVMFLDPSGSLDPAIGNERSPKFKYFYTSSLDLVKSMHVALQRHGKPT